MKKSIANIFLAIILTVGLSALSLAQTNVRIKSAINTAGAGKCLDVANGQTTAGTPIVQFDCHNGTNQRFTIEQVTFGGKRIIRTNLNLNMCVGINTNSYANPGELLRLIPCRVNGDIQLGAMWTLDNINGKTRSRILNPSSDRFNTCIDIPSGSSNNSLWLQLYYCHEGANQQWNIF